jgi:ABC-2 type transport system permease protein
MVLYIILMTFGPSMGFEHPLFIYGSVPAVPLSDMTGTGNFAAAAWAFRLFWAAAAALLLVVVHLLWPRGTEERLKPRVRQIPARLTGLTRLATVTAAAAFVLSGSWIIYNTFVLNDFRSSRNEQQYLAEYEKRFFHYAPLPQPVVRHVELDVALYPGEIRAEVRGRYRLVNETESPVERVHVRLMNRDLHLVELDFPASRLERNDEEFGYRIYLLDAPMQPGEARSFSFRTRREQVGFRAGGTEMAIVPNGTDLDSLELTPRIGMTDVGLIQEPAVRREYGLPEQRPFPKLDDMAVTQMPPNGDLSWTTADITVSTTADQIPVAPGKKVSERVDNGRRIVRFVSETPIKNFFSIQSARYAVTAQTHAGVEYAVYSHPTHQWNVDRMMKAMQASIDYYTVAFGPYQFDQARIVETPAYRDGAQAFANTIPIAENVGFAMDLRDPGSIDMVSVITAHELAHQWWGHQIVGARMQGVAMLHETLAQYSALMVMKRLQGQDKIRLLLQFQLDRYLSGRRTQVLAEQPLASVELSQQHIAYGKGALAMYLLQQRMGEEAVNRALRRYVERYRFTVAPYPRSLDFIAFLREEAKTPENQALITDLFERITIYELRVDKPTAVKRADGRWDVTVPVEARKAYADGRGKERDTPLSEPIEIGLFTAEPGSDAFGSGNILMMELRPIRSGRQVLRFITDQRPTHAGVDPYNLYIDRNSGDNVAAVLD